MFFLLYLCKVNVNALFWGLTHQIEAIMKDRIRNIMESRKMTQQEFAEFIGMSPASLSSIFNGRTRPTLNIVEAIKNKIPSISTDWLMFGTGTMYESESSNVEQSKEETHSSTASGMLDFSAQGEIPTPDLFTDTSAQRVPKMTPNQAKNIINILDKKTRKITEIRIFFDDKTWETFVPKE